MRTVEIGIGLGSNIGDKVEHIRRAMLALEQQGIAEDIALSSLYRTAPYGHVTEQDWFVNACAIATTSLSPADLLVRFKSIERRLGRTKTVRWGPRVIDIDLLFYGHLSLDSPGLTIPHKDLLRRAFVLVPLVELKPDLVISGVAVKDAVDALDRTGVERLDTPV